MSKHLPPPKNKHVRPAEQKHMPRASAEKTERESLKDKSLSASLVLPVVFAALLLIAALFLPTEGWIRMVSFLLPTLLAGFELFRRTVEKFLARDIPSEELIVTAACAASFAIGEYPAGALIMILYRLEELMAVFAVQKSRAGDGELSALRIEKANLEKPEGIVTVRTEQVAVGDILIVSPDEQIPVDGVIIDGMTSIDASAITGDPSPLTVAEGSTVLSGCVNLSRNIRLRAVRSYEDSAAERISEAIREASARRSRYEVFLSRFARIFTPAVFFLALIIGVVVPAFNGQWREWIRRAVIFLVASGSCGLALSIPVALYGGILSASRRGIYVQGFCFLEALSRAETMIFDKTGTITEGRYTVTEVFPENVNELLLLKIAALAEGDSQHPIARALREAGGISGEDAANVVQVEQLPGMGVSAFVDKRHVYVGNASLLEEHSIPYKVPNRGGAAIHVAVDNIYWGCILLSDKIKEGAFDVVESIRHEGVRNLVLLTGDVRSISRTIASSLNFDMVKSELQPAGKVSAVEYLMAAKGDSSTLAFVGDAESDEEALSRADVGIAVGAVDEEGAFEKADILVMSEDIRRLPVLMKLARQCADTVRQNIALVLLAKLVILLLGVIGLLPVAAAAAIDTAVYILCMLNSLKTVQKGKEKENEYGP